MGLKNLLRKPIIDKNGKATTVLVRPEEMVAKKPMLASIPRRVGESYDIPEIPTTAKADWEHGSYSGTKLEHERMLINGYPTWELAPAGYSGAYCGRCGSFFEEDEVTGRDVTCTTCGYSHWGGHMQTAVRMSDIKFFDEAVTRRTPWYHITTKANWGNDITKDDLEHQPLVHVGSLEAAERRMRDLTEDHERRHQYSKSTKPLKPLTFYCYTIQLKSDAPIANSVVNDYDSAAPTSVAEVEQAILDDIQEDGTRYDDKDEFYSMYELYGATRYINQYEDHGSVSLVAHPSSFEITERVKWTGGVLS